jgi:hypothetical protein
MKKEVLVIFKTHLDIGFTDYAENVYKRYLNEYIPNAIKVGYELKDTDTPFVWTVGSWLIWQALKNDADGKVAKAIKDGILRWHALPFTTHTELMNPALFEYGLGLSKKLDERFGFKTLGAKMTDVPGHTIGMIPIMKKHGVKFLHIGVNPATPLPPVPPLFKWKYGDDEITVMYQGDYGQDLEFGDFVVCFAHTGDNHGPQSSEKIVEVYHKLKEKYPDYSVRVGTIDDLAEKILTIDDLPIVEKEIGDTWIHGAGTDPQKVSRYRKLLRHMEAHRDISADLSDSLLCVPEHTWGMDVKTYFPYDKFYSHTDILPMPAERSKIEKSWLEQRAYVEKAEKLLGVSSDYPIQKPDLSDYTEIEIPSDTGYEISWQLFDNSDYERYKNDYMRCHVKWAMWDFTKMGLEDYVGGTHIAKVTRAFCKENERLYILNFDNDVKEKYGLPEFRLKICGEDIELTWFGKQPSRLPQAFWFKIKGMQEDWLLHKLGTWISPCEILGSPLICGIDKGIKNSTATILSLDCALVAPYGRRLLQYNCKDLKQDMYFNLYNNIWNTNFPMWYSDDAIFRFKIQK